MPDCTLCRTASDPASSGELLIAETTASVLVLHEDWSPRGHAVAIAKSHVQNLSDLPADSASLFMADVARLERAMLKHTGAARAVLFKLGVAVPHLHVHIYPAAQTADRAAIMKAIDGKAGDELTGTPRAAFIESIRAEMRQKPPSPEGRVRRDAGF